MKIATSAPAAGTVASVTTDYPSAEAVRALVIKAASINCPISLNVLAQRNLTVQRIEPGTENVLIGQTYAVPNTGGSDREIEFSIDVAIFPGAAVRAFFDDCAAGERQWIIINYDEVAA